MEQGTSEPLRCEVCGDPIRSTNKLGVCSTKVECRTARVRVKRGGQAKLEPKFCEICGDPIRSDNQYGICQGRGKPECARARDRKMGRRKTQSRARTQEQRQCEVCGKPIRRDNQTGICGNHDSPECMKARKQRLAEQGSVPARPPAVEAGDVFGKWTVLEICHSGEDFVSCRCECGTERPVRAKRLVFGETRDCGCVRESAPRKSRAEPYIPAGAVFARFTNLEDVWHWSDKARVCCECGTEKLVAAQALKNGHTLSCGCLKRERISTQKGFSRHPLYGTWNSMLDRCTNPKDPGYGNYGASGITVCDRWRDPWLFAEDIVREIGPRPPMMLASGRPLYTLDRINPELGYLPGNVRWATASEQNSNQRKVGPLMSERNALAAEVERLTRLLGDAGL